MFTKWMVAVTLAALACSPWESEEIGRYGSPDSVLDAVVVRSSGGATTSYVYRVYVVLDGEPIPDAEIAVLVADRVRELHVFWLEPRHLRVEYEYAEIHGYRNHAVAQGTVGGPYDTFVEVQRDRKSVV